MEIPPIPPSPPIPPMPPKCVTYVFSGPMTHPHTQSLRNVLCAAANENVTDVTLLLNSSGGTLSEGLSIYNLLVGMPYRLHTHNLNIVQSIANVVFLAGGTRSMAPESSFLLHGFTWTFSAQEVLDETQIADRASNLTTGRAEFVQIFERTTTLRQKDFDDRGFFTRANIVLPDEALALGIVSKVEDYKHPPGVPILNIGI